MPNKNHTILLRFKNTQLVVTDGRFLRFFTKMCEKIALRKLLHLKNLRKSFTGAAVLYLPRSFLNGGLLLGMVTLVPWKRQLFAHGEAFRYDNVRYDEIVVCQKEIEPHILSLFLQKMRHRYSRNETLHDPFSFNIVISAHETPPKSM